ncbi:hypothetical protein C3L33_06302, partial [Rhododendron williamsianum]
MRRTRKISGFETTAVDRISEFPDSVLVHILSFLEIEDAVRTQVLSKRWQFLWTFLPSLLFRYYGFDDDGYYDDDDEGEDFRFARNSDFVTFVGKRYFLLTASSRNSRLILNTTRASLRMSIRGLNSPQERASRSFPFNSRLSPSMSCHSFCTTTLGSKDISGELQILAPYLLSLEMSGRLGSNCRFTNISSLVDAVFNSDFRCYNDDEANDYERIQNILVVFLASLLHVKNLTLGTWAIQGGGTYTDFWSAATISDDLMRYHCDSNLLSFVQFLLRNARVLQKMVISMRSDDRLKECFEAAKKLISFPRSSPDATVIFC